MVEDQVDGVVCAYVARYAAMRPDDVTTYGDFETGYIVTPTLPPTLTPSPRPPKASKVATDPVREYTAQHRARVAAGEQFLALVTSVLDEGGINYLSVTGRTKTVASFAEKARRTRDGVLLYTDPLREITDTIGIRVPDLPAPSSAVLDEVGAVLATSANLHGGSDPRRLEDVPEEIRRAAGALVDAGELPGTPSTVLDLTGPEPKVLREGAVPAAEALGLLTGG